MAGSQEAEAVHRLLDGIRDLPTPPLVFTQIVRVVDNPDASAYDVARLLAEDPALSAKVLRITNSAYYGLPGNVTSIKHAVVLIGLNGIRSLVLSAAVIDLFKGDRIGQAFQDAFWRHSLVTAFGARMLLRSLCPEDIGAGEQGFAAGLLHDIGKMMLYLHAPDRARAAARADGAEGELEAEREQFGFDHAQVGQAVAERWNLPRPLCLAIGFHHRPLACPDPGPLVDTVYVADALAYHSLAEGADRAAPRIDPKVFDRSGLKLEEVSGYIGKLKAEYIHAETFVNLARGDR